MSATPWFLGMLWMRDGWRLGNREQSSLARISDTHLLVLVQLGPIGPQLKLTLHIKPQTLIRGDYDSPYSLVVRSVRQKLNREIRELTDVRMSGCKLT